MTEYVYILQCPNSKLVKIGRTGSNDPRQRISSIQTANPYPLDIVTIVEAERSTESDLHQKFAQHRFNREWFSGECLEAVLLEVAGFPVYVKKSIAAKRFSDLREPDLDSDPDSVRGHGSIGTVLRYGIYVPHEASKEVVEKVFQTIRYFISEIDFDLALSLYVDSPDEDSDYLGFLRLVYAGYPYLQLENYCQSIGRAVTDFPVYIDWKTVEGNPMLGMFLAPFLFEWNHLNILNPSEFYLSMKDSLVTEEKGQLTWVSIKK